MSGKRKERAKVEAMELGNYEKVVNFYKSTFEDLTMQIQQLHNDITKLREENIQLKKEIGTLNERLFFLTKNHPEQ